MSDHLHPPWRLLLGTCGVDAAVLEESDEETLNYGRKFTPARNAIPAS
jgi:hypothetical protein